MSMLSKAIEHSFRIEEQWDESHIACDLMIEPKVKHFGKTEFSNLELIYNEGRRSAQAAIPEIKQLIENFNRSKGPIPAKAGILPKSDPGSSPGWFKP